MISFSRSLEQFFLTVCQNNFGNKIPFLLLESWWSNFNGFSNQISEAFCWSSNRQHLFEILSELFKNSTAVCFSKKIRPEKLKYTKERAICTPYFIYTLFNLWMFQLLRSVFCQRSRRQQNSSRHPDIQLKKAAIVA